MPQLSDPREERACDLRAQGKTQIDAFNEAFGVAADSKANNSSRFFRRRDVRDRVAQLQHRRAELANIDQAWALIELKRRVDGFNLDDYLTKDRPRFFRLDDCTREQLGKLSELTIEEFVTDKGDGERPQSRLKRTKIKPYDPAAIIGLMARIAGWEAPKRSELTGKDGAPLLPEFTDEQRAKALAAFMAKNAA